MSHMLEETVIKVADYSNEEKRRMMIVGVIMTSRHFKEIQKYKMKLLARLRK